MKKLILLILIPLFIGCAGTFQQASHTSRQVYIGMPIKDFQDIAGKKAKLEAMESGYTVYRMNDYDVWYGYKTDTKFFYFDSNGKLYKVDGGEFKQNRYQIEVINK
jgi:hypothetical protein